MKLWMKAMVWLGLGGGIGFFAGWQFGEKRARKEAQEDMEDAVNADRDKIERQMQQVLDETNRKHEEMVASMRKSYEEALEAQREYLGGKDDQIISEVQVEMDLDEDADEDVMDEDLDIDDLDSGYYEDPDGDDIPAFHPEDIRPFAITASDYLQNEHGYDKVELDYYTDDCVIFDPLREEKWTHPEQLLGIGWTAMFIGGDKPIREAYVQNDTMEILYKITRIDDSFERLYEEE
jgi:hypothetical protein